jgi:hypothetical protein
MNFSKFSHYLLREPDPACQSVFIKARYSKRYKQFKFKHDYNAKA